MQGTVTDAVLIGIDIGTGSVKAVMTDLGGDRLDGYAAAYPTRRPGPGMVEQDPADWMRHVEAALARFARHPRAAQVAAVGITSHVNSHVFCGADLVPLAPCIVWQDGRAAPQAARLDAMLTPEEKIAALGAPIPIDASHALARIAWMAEHRPEVRAATAHVLAPKDHAIARLTGRVAADPIASVGLVGADLGYADAVLALLPGARDLLPPLVDPLAVLGPIRAAPFAGVPVVAGTMDAWAAMFGVGVARDGQAMNLSGTSEVLGLISPRRNPVAGVVTFPDWAGITLHAGPTQAGGASLDWLGRIMGRTASELSALVADTRIEGASPLFLPHLQGERAPLWDTQARGTFAGLSASHGPAEIVAAVMEGVAFSGRLALEALERSGGVRPLEIRCGGGGALSDAWCRIKADVFGRDLRRMDAPDAGAVGALVMAGVGAGLMPDLAAATRSLVRTDRVFHPAERGAALAEERFALFTQLYEAARPVNAALAAASS